MSLKSLLEAGLVENNKNNMIAAKGKEWNLEPKGTGQKLPD